MDIDTMKQLIKKYEPGHTAFVTRADIAERYYRNETDILFRDKQKEKEKEESDNPLGMIKPIIAWNFVSMLPILPLAGFTTGQAITVLSGRWFQANRLSRCLTGA